MLLRTREQLGAIVVVFACVVVVAAQSASARGITSSIMYFPGDDGDVISAQPIAYANSTSELVRSLGVGGGQGSIVSSVISATGAAASPRQLFDAPLGFRTATINDDTGLVVANDPANGRILARTVGAGGEIGSTVTIVSDLSSDSGLSALASAGGGEVAVVWTESFNGTTRLVSRTIDASGALGAETELDEVQQSWSEDGAAHTGYLIDVEADGHGDGTASITWQNSDCHTYNCFNSIESARLAPNGVVSRAQVLPRNGLWVNKTSSARKDGSLDIVWSERTYWLWRTYLVKVAPDGSVTAPIRKCVESDPVATEAGRRQCLFSSNGWSYDAVESLAMDGGPDGGETLLRGANGRLSHFDVALGGLATSAYRVGDFPAQMGLSAIDVGAGAAFGIWTNPSSGAVRAQAFSASGPIGPESSWSSGIYPQPVVSRLANRSGDQDQVVAWATWFDSSAGGIRVVKFTPVDERTGPSADPDNPTFSQMLSMGDSVSSGEGIGYGIKWVKSDTSWEYSSPDGKVSNDWLPRRSVGPIEEPPSACRRNANAYPYEVARAVGANLTHLACSGATAHDARFGWTTHGVGIPAQLPGPDAPAAADAESPITLLDPELITLTLGANDVKFGDLVKRCYTGDCGGVTDDGDTSLLLARQKNNLRAFLSRIAADAEGVSVKPIVAVALYYDPFPPKYDSTCRDLAPGGLFGNLSAEEMSFLRAKLKILNANIEEVVYERDANGVRKFPDALTVDLGGDLGPLVGHRWCSDQPWIYGPSIGAPAFLGGLPEAAAAPFHPTEKGQAAIASAFVDAVGDSKGVSEAPSWLLFDLVGGIVRVKVGALEGGNLTVRKLGEVAGLTQRSASSRAMTADAVDLDAAAAPNDIAVSEAYELTFGGESLKSAQAEFMNAGADEHAYQWNGTSWIQLQEDRSDDRLRVDLIDTGAVLIGKQVPAIHASFSTSDSCQAPCEVTFDASASAVDSGAIDSYEWTFGDGATANGSAATHVFAAGGSYQASLKVTSDSGAVATDAHEIQISSPKSLISLDGPTTVTAGTAVTYSASAQTNDASTPTVYWAFDGDPDPDAGLTKTRIFTEPRQVVVRAAVANASGEIASKEITLLVVDPASTGAIPPAAPPLKISTKSSKISARQLRRTKRISVSCSMTVAGKCLAEAFVSRKVAASLHIPNRKNLKSVQVASGTVWVTAGRASALEINMRKKIATALSAVRKATTLVIQLNGTSFGATAATRTTVTVVP